MPRSAHVIGLIILAGAASEAMALDFKEARHLLARTGFGCAHPTEIEALLPLTREQAVDKLLAECKDVAHISPPSWCADNFGESLRQRDEQSDAWYKLEREEYDKLFGARQSEDRQRGAELKAWWYQIMVTTTSPLTERMTLFWHNHFTSGLQTVENPRLMYEQNALLRKYSTENFGQLSLAIPCDPAMFRYLDGNSNVAGRPNENFAREVMELFTVGEGNYTEADIKEAARAFTGYQIDYGTGKAKMDDRRHDGGRKVVLGHKGVFDGDGILTVLLLKEKDVALNVAGKFWREFISETPDDKQIYQIAKKFYESRYNIKPGLKATLMCDAFWDPAGYGNLTKSPVELVVGTVRTLGLKADTAKLNEMARKLGQDLMDPPNVKGWKGGKAWISTQSLIGRWEVLEELLDGSSAKPAKRKNKAADEGMNMISGGDDADGAIVAAGDSSWIQDASKKGFEGISLAVMVLLPILPGRNYDGNSPFDPVIRDSVMDPAYNLK
jgi:uncharacterized protein (DUF1800 family)